ncbi:MAG: non-ribosomal peptide synthase/polyketide synthase [Ferruginibacter sp.]
MGIQAITLLQTARRNGVHISVNNGELQLKLSKGVKIDPQLLQEIKDNKQLLLEFLLDDKWKSTKVTVAENEIKPFDRNEIKQVPLSFSQERLWFINQLEGSVQYHLPIVLKLKGKLNIDALKKAFGYIIERHEVLRTIILEEDGRPFQQVSKSNQCQLTISDGAAYKNDVALLQPVIEKLIRAPFDLAKDFMLRAHLVQIDEAENILVVTMHHIASDGWSLGIIVQEVAELYRAFEENRLPQLPVLPVQYADFAYWQKTFLQGEVLDKKLAYWKNKLSGVAPLELPLDFPRPQSQTSHGAIADFLISNELTNDIQLLARQEQATMFMTLLAAFNVLLYRYSGQADICVGTPTAGRQQAEVENLVGFFINTLALRTDVNGADSFTKLLQQVRATTMEAYEHQEASFEKVVESVVKERDLSRSPLFQVMFVLQNAPEAAELTLHELTLSRETQTHNTAKFDLSFYLTETSNGLQAMVEYNTDLFLKTTITQMIGHFQALLQAIVDTPAKSIGTLSMLSEIEEQQLLIDFNDNKQAYPKNETILDLLNNQVQKTPDGIAFVFDEESITYSELDARSNQLAHYLNNRGVKAETLVPICIERSLQMVVGILGILKSGAAYVPIDPAYPAERIQYMLEDIDAKLLITSRAGNENIKTVASFDIIQLDTDWPTISQSSSTGLSIDISQEQLAYVIYTSGSTGTPKGVILSHANLHGFICWCKQEFAASNFEIVYAGTSICFDLSIYEIFYPLSVGKRVRIIESGLHIGQYLPVDKSVLLNSVPVVIENLLNEQAVLPNVTVINMAGEPISAYVQKNIDTENIEVRNLYGPTEDTTYSTVFRLKKDERILIGRPIANTNIYILNKEQALVPVGVAGEICISGDGLAKGYINRPELTAERFVVNPFGKDAGSRMYKTGDLGKWLADGTIDYLGRIDDQVKIRGYRIELGEIETVLQQTGLVKQSVVLAKPDTSGSKRLVGYIVAEPAFDKQALVQYLKDKLPVFMVPDTWVELDQLPLTPNGKIDKKALPDPGESDLVSNEFVAPRNITEESIAAIWCRLLSKPQIGVFDNFFELGGHSLLATRIISAIRKELKVELPIKALFLYPTIAALSGHLNEQGSGLIMLPSIEKVVARPTHIPLSFSQERLWVVDQLEGTVQYHLPAVLRLKGKLNQGALIHALRQVVNRHEILRTIYQESGGKAYQLIMEPNAWNLTVADGSIYKNDRPALQQYLQQLITVPFNLAQDHMLRADLVTIDEQDAMLVVTMHHIASDGWSISIFVKDVVAAYKAYTNNETDSLPPLNIQYADFAIWQRNYLQGALLAEKLAYWKMKLDAVATLQLPADFTRPLVQSTHGAIEGFRIDPDLSGQLQKLGKTQHTTLFMTLLAAFKVLLYRYSGQEDICVGTPIANRTQHETEALIGFFINTLALRSSIQPTLSFTDFLQQVKQTTLQAYEHQDVPFEKVVEAVVKEREMSRSPLFQVAFMLQNTPEVQAIDLGEVELSGESFIHDSAKFEITFTLTERAGELLGNVEYNTDLYGAATIKRMVVHYKKLLHSIVKAPQQQVGVLPILSDEEVQTLLIDFNDHKAFYPEEKSLVQLFTEQATQTPEAIALVFDGTNLSYEELDEQSNQLANYLIGLGIQPGQNIGLLSYRGIEMITGMLGILKAGAVYVPFNTEYPAERLNHIINDAAIKHLVYTDESLLKSYALEGCENIFIRNAAKSSKAAPSVNTNIDAPVYIMYTSGTTGLPKGIVVSNRNIIKLVYDEGAISVRAGDRMLQWSNYSFDGSTYEIYSSLLKGASLHLLKENTASDVYELSRVMKEQKISVCFITTALFNSFIDTNPETFKQLRKVLFGGEMVSVHHVRKAINVVGPNKLVHVYGPTETTVYATAYPINEVNQHGSIPIGKPLCNTTAFILSRSGEVVPIGVPGELFIGGDGVSLGYVNNEILTEERFIEKSFENIGEQRLYKTGDICRWLPDGNIEYLGRIDDQVKIRGYRIELGEIEAVLQQSGLVHQSVVLAKANSEGTKRLIGYVVPATNYSKEGVTDYLRSRLPDYMVPQLWLELEALPLTPNGKVDKKSLPDVAANELLGNEYVAPRNELESLLASTWQKLLGIERAGIHDNFFELGGDSILTIQVVSRIRRQGYELQPRDIFIHQTIARLSAALAERSGKESTAEQGALTGYSGLLPIQQWYLQKDNKAVDHFNQAILLGINKTITKEILEKAIEQLLLQHDALRFKYSKENNQWQQEYGTDKSSVTTINLTDQSNGTLADKIRAAADQSQRMLNIATGKLVNVVLMQTPETETHNRILLVIHHLAIDGVSWRILLEDLELSLNALSKGEAIVTGSKSSSYRQWYQAIEQYGQTKKALSQKYYWQQAIESYTPLPVDKVYGGLVKTADKKSLSVRLDATQTRSLLQEIPHVYHTEINDLLLCALAGSLCAWDNRSKVIIGLEGHGREAIGEGIDTSRTVGWFTNLYPLMLAVEQGATTGDQIKSIKEQLRRVPDRGLGYGVLKYINKEAALQVNDGWDIVFNYLGQFDNVVNESKWLTGAGESTGIQISELYESNEKISVNGFVQSGELVLNWGYSSLHYDVATIEKLAADYIAKLQELIADCLQQEGIGEVYTPSDYGLGDAISYTELDAFLNKSFNGKKRSEQVEGLYRLSGLQQGMLFHGLYDDQSGAYIEQFKCDLVNANLDHLKNSWQQVLKNHSILRSGFYYDVFTVPVQCVYQQVSLPVEVIDFSGLNSADQATAVNKYEAADRQQGFDFTAAPLMRIGLLKLSEDRYRMVWTSHHILFDGWSMPLLMEEFLSTYESLNNGTAIVEQEEDKFEDYIRYIERNNKDAEESFWRNYMKGIGQGTLLPFINTTSERTKGAGSYQSLRLHFDEKQTSVILDYAQRNRVTVNTVMQSVWSLMLQRYTGNKDIVYGVIVSGRPDELPNVEKRVGMYINTLPLHATIEENQPITDWLKLLQDQQVAARQYQYTPLQNIKSWSGVPGDLFDCLLIFENYPVSEIIGARKWSLGIENVKVNEQTNYPLNLIVSSAKELNIDFSYNTALLKEVYVKEMHDHFEHILNQFIANEKVQAADIQLITAEQKNQLLVDFNNTAVAYPKDKTFVDLFMEGVDKFASNTAVIFEQQQITYKELNERSNQLAHLLIDKGLKPQTLVPVCLDRSINLVVAILGVLKAGCAYVPIDPEYPADRISFMLENSDADIVITSNESKSKLVSASNPFILELDESLSILEGLPVRNIQLSKPHQLAYVIYTSGSTGKPKGAGVFHKSIVSLAQWYVREFSINETDRAIIISSPAFDLTQKNIWGPLIAGAAIVMPATTYYDNRLIINCIREKAVTIINCAPHAFYPLAEEDVSVSSLPTLRLVVLGGEPIHLHRLKNWVLSDGYDCEIVNSYGPTECTDIASFYRMKQPAEYFNKLIPMGHPNDNVQLYILDKSGQLLPIGLMGEIYIGGDGVGAGYVKDDNLTSQKFISNPFSKEPGSRLYKTGDLGLWLPDGNIEYLGRIDDQVKIRGYRIELGEIETVLQQSGLVHQSVVLAKENSEGTKRLIGYVVPASNFSKDAVTDYLRSRLPDYMVPQLWVELDALPLTPNGKVDKKSLPDVAANELLGNEYVAPSNELENHLATTWQKLLGIERVGIHDNFFELGGDSILTIQVVSRIRRLGYELQPRDIFIHQTIARLSAALAERSGKESTAEQGALTGYSGLLPIQQWYLQKDNKAVGHFNQAILLGIDKSITKEILEKSIEQLLLQHDALRFKYSKEDNQWQQEYGTDQGSVTSINLSDQPGETLADKIREVADQSQRLLNIATGKLVNIVLMQTPQTETHNRILMVIHHLAIDGVSWRILLEDLELMLNALSKGEPIVMGSKSSSYRQWYQALEQYGQTKKALSQKDYWQKAIESYTALPVDKAYNGLVKTADKKSFSVRLDATQTRSLLQEVPHVYHTEINDLLLCALAGSLCAWDNKSKVIIGLEGHGREAIGEGIDTSRTVGWLTNLYPLLLITEHGTTTGDQIKSIKEQLRSVPDRGLGYGVLKYINKETALKGGDTWDIVFNYLGQFDNVVNESKWLTGATESTGASVSEQYEVGEKIAVNAMVQSGELVINWTYSTAHFESTTIESLADENLFRLKSLIEHCLQQEVSGEVYTPSDYGLAESISYHELDAFFNESFNGKKRSEQVEGLYRLSGLQQGMLFHGLYDDKAGAYIEQFKCDLVNANLDHLKNGWQRVINNHSILRSGFYYDVFNVPVQCVYKGLNLPLEVLDYCNLNETEQAAAVLEFESTDRQLGFDFSAAPLMRITLIKLSADRYHMVWTFHHILFDGWSLSVLMEEFLSTYESLNVYGKIKEQEEDKYEDYIRYMEREDKEAEENYWRNYLAGVEQSTLLPFIGTTTERTKGAGKYGAESLHINEQLTAKINKYAQQNRLTVNSIMQGIWALLLHHYTGNKNIVYGVIVSGRPDDLPNVEKRVGMYINTLPLHATIENEQSITKWFEQIQTEQVASRQFQYTPLHDVQSFAGVKGDLFDSLLIFENYPVSEIIGAKKWSLDIEQVQMEEQTNYPLSVIISSAQKIEIGFSYNTDLLEKLHVQKIAAHFENVLEQLINNTESRIGEIDIITNEERNQLLNTFNHSGVGYPKTLNMVDMFEAQVAKTPAAIALTFQDETITYHELNERSNQLANYLQSKGVQAETLVPICVERGIQMIVGILGILKAGAAYVPMDPEYPAERIKYMLEDTGASLVVSSIEGSYALDSSLPVEVIALDGKEMDAINLQPVQNLSNKIAPEQVAYVIYTSGSTGRPKGVLIEHRNVVRLFENDAPLYDFNDKDVWTMFHSFCFDFSVWEMYGALFYGGRLVIVPGYIAKDAMQFAELLVNEKVTILNQTPSAFYVLQDAMVETYKTNATRYVIYGGEALNPAKLKPWKKQYPGCRLINMYGITETTVHVTYQEIGASQIEAGASVIGKPIPTLKAYVLNGDKSLVPVGVTGELYIAGAGVARGYLNRPELTAEKFMDDPFDTESNARMYRTGDLGRWLSDGTLEYLGRIDEQVKIRGYRIELGEIETVLLQTGQVSQGVVLARADQHDNNRLIAYVVPAAGYDKEVVKGILSSKLPDYMVPALWVTLQSFPLTSNGKVNKKLLPDPDAGELLSNEYVAPRNNTEKILAETWQKLLAIERVGVYDNFFELGGHSLLATRTVSVIRKQLEVELPIRSLFLYPTVSTLSEHIHEQNNQLTLLPPIEKVTLRPEFIPLSFSQERLWFIDKLEQSSQYHIPVVIRLKGNLNIPALVYALRQVVNRHEVLRTVFRETAGNGYQLIKAVDEWDLTIIDGAVYKADPASLSLQNYIQQLIAKPFDLANDDMLRADLVTLDMEDAVLVVTMHHIAADGWSISILVKEVVAGYQSFAENTIVPVDPLPVQYADYAIWQRNYLAGALLEKEVNYWKAKLDSVATLQLPTDFNRPLIQGSRGAMQPFRIDTQLTGQLSNLSKSENTTLFMTLLAAFKVLLYRYSGQEDISVGTPIANRTQEETESLIGFFINTLALRDNVVGGDSFTALLQQVKQTTLDAYEHQDVPFEKVVEAVIKERDMSRSPLFQIMFVLQNTPEVQALDLGDVELSTESFEHEISKFEITFYITEKAGELQGNVEYNTDLFSTAGIQKMIAHYHQLLTAIVTSPQQRIAELPMLQPDEVHQLVIENNNTVVNYPANQTLVSLFEKQVLETPSAVALKFEDSAITYQQLNIAANKLAHHLIKLGVTASALIPVCMESSIDMLVGILGVLKAGAVYVPIDAYYPSERINYMLEDTAADVLVTDEAFVNRFNLPANLQVVSVDRDVVAEQYPETNPSIEISEDDVACIIYTSGSSGKPKGVQLTNKGIVNRMYWMWNSYPFTTGETSAIKTSISFVDHIWEMFGPLCAGIPSVIFKKDDLLDLDVLYEKLSQYKITRWVLVPSLLRNLLIKLKDENLALRELKYWTCSGEIITADLVKEFYALFPSSAHKLLNIYGSSEVTADVTCFETSPDTIDQLIAAKRNVPIGKPIANCQVYILDKQGGLVAEGAIGEICVGGVQVANGYLNNDALTAEKFVANPFSEVPGAKMYKTGDQGRWLKDGNIEYLGRADNQVKIRGYRIELGEIENVLQQCELVHQSVVLATKDANENLRLVAYIVPETTFEKDGIIDFVKDRLPEYMVPSLWIELAELPLTANGKIDRKALPEPDRTLFSIKDFVAPRNKTEIVVGNIWQQLLNIEQVSVHDNFFELGGHSLLAMRVVAAIRMQLEVELGIRDLFAHPTIASLAIHLSKQQTGLLLPAIERGKRPVHIPLSFSQERLWFIHSLESSTQYHLPIVLQLNGKLNKDALSYAFKSVINRHEILRTVVREESGVAWQYVMDLDWSLEIINAPQYQGDSNALLQFTQQLINAPFNLSEDAMIRATLIVLSESENVLVVTMHHIASDAWSLSVFVNEVVTIYNQLDKKLPVLLPALPIQYADYALWQRKYLDGELLSNKLEYWKHQLQGVSPLQLPTDYVRPAVWSSRGAMADFNIDVNLTRELQQLGQQNGATLFMTLLAAFKVLLNRYTSQEDICVGTVTANRPQQELENLIGFFVNALALRTQVNTDLTFIELLQQVTTTTMEAYEHQDLPFEKVVEVAAKDRDLSRSPIFQVVFVLQNAPPTGSTKLGEVIVSNQTFIQDTAKYDLTFFITETANGLQGKVEYCTDLFSEATITRMIGHYKTMLESIAKLPTEKIGLLKMLSAEEENQLLIDFNNTETHWVKDKTIVQLFEEQVALTPNATALVFENELLTYKQLDERSNQLAHHLLANGVKKESLVPIFIKRSIDLITGLLAILKAGGCYVPIDPEYPVERINYMLQDTGASLVITDDGGVAVLSKEKSNASPLLINLDKDWAAIEQLPKSAVRTKITPDQLAYVIYTSGSTGRPKGVMIEHINVMNLVQWHNNHYKVNSLSRCTAMAGIAFDAFGWEIWPYLSAGAGIYIVDDETRLSSTKLLNLFNTNDISHSFLSTALMPDFVKETKGKKITLRYLLTGGDKLSGIDLHDLTYTIINNYGPTENTVVTTCYELKNDDFALPPIGKPIDNNMIQILNANNQLVPIGVTGEICIGGAGLARGYLNLPEMTTEKFINNPHITNESILKIYRSGDLGRWLPDGNIEYQGRKDEQVKVRGFRIELGEIENVIQESGHVSQSIVLAKENKDGLKQLVGYIVPQNEFVKEQLVEFLLSRLPVYMVPQLWVEIEQMPLTANGKVDKKRLPDTESVHASAGEYVAPRNEIEQKLVMLWQELLNVERVGVNDNFFELGGHSLLAMRMVAYIERNLLLTIPIKVLFQFTCISDLSKYLELQKKDTPPENNPPSFQLLDI